MRFFGRCFGVHRARSLIGAIVALALMIGCTSSGPVTPPQDPGADGPTRVVSFSLIDAESAQPLAGFDPIQEGATLDLSQLASRALHIRVNTDPPTVGSVMLRMVSDAGLVVQDDAPYVLFAEEDAELAPLPGVYHLNATPYNLPGGQGTAGDSLSLSFRVSDGQSPPPPPAPPEQPSPPAPPEEPSPPAPPGPPETPSGETLALRVSGSSSGRSVQNIGAGADVFNNDSFSIADVRDLGITAYRYFGGMEEFEPEDDNGVYGSPSIQEVKSALSANPGRAGDFVNLQAFDRNMAAYGRILRQLNTIPGMEPIGMLRNSSNRSAFWLPRMNASGPSCRAPGGSRIVWPEFSQADWNEWWQHVFAVVYWINVRNGSDMRVDHWSVHNEPNQQPEQGWCGTKEQYLDFLRYTRDAIDFVYETYLDDRPRFVHGGVLAMTRYADWLRALFREQGDYSPSMFNVIDVHPFFLAPRTRVPQIRALTRESGVPSYVRDYPIWLSEMGGYAVRSNELWGEIPEIIDYIVDNLIVLSTPGEGRVDGAVFWRMYDDDNLASLNGLIESDGTRRPGFYALRMAIQALNGGKPVYPTQLPGSDDVMAITTRNEDGSYNLLVSNRSTDRPRDVRADLSALLPSGSAELYRFSAERSGALSTEPLARLELSGGEVRFNLPPLSVALVRVQP